MTTSITTTTHKQQQKRGGRGFMSLLKPNQITRLHFCIQCLLLFSCHSEAIKLRQSSLESNHIRNANRSHDNAHDLKNDIAIASYRDEYQDNDNDFEGQFLQRGKASEFKLKRFQSPTSIQKALSLCRNQNTAFKYYKGKDGRKGFVSNTKLGGDWVLAESQQVAVQCKTHDVLRAYMSSELQEQWNTKEVLNCNIKRKSKTNANGKMGEIEEYYQQDLVLHSKRIIRSHTGIMKYSQTITIDKIGQDNYSVLIGIDPEQHQSKCKPFDSLSVYVGLQQNGDDVNIYAAGLIEVNRKVVPNLIVFDASGIAGSIAGKATLWLAAYFERRQK
mmetsp:Transcript_17788/g.20265  ORF Transcript_17788/g.20265 Transcript_17788/m.20265 type:complete len:331 (-) Transcript_17788:166-1158(-)